MRTQPLAYNALLAIICFWPALSFDYLSFLLVGVSSLVLAVFILRDFQTPALRLDDGTYVLGLNRFGLLLAGGVMALGVSLIVANFPGGHHSTRELVGLGFGLVFAAGGFLYMNTLISPVRFDTLGLCVPKLLGEAKRLAWAEVTDIYFDPFLVAVVLRTSSSLHALPYTASGMRTLCEVFEENTRLDPAAVHRLPSIRRVFG